jgi:hypothetical protein
MESTSNLKPIRITTIKETENNKCWGEYGEIRPLYTFHGNIKWYSLYGKYYSISQKIQNRIIL